MISLTGYEIQNKVYESDESLVFSAVRNYDSLPVTIKILNTNYPSPEESAQLKYEYEVTKDLEIEGIVKTYDILRYNNSYALIKQNFEGQPLSHLISNGLSIREFLEISISVTNTIDALHKNGIIHKDIQPDNIIINTKNNEIKITDFRTSSLLNNERENILNQNLNKGNPDYMSPEQTGRMNRTLDYRTDLYSLGVTFYEMLTGKKPFNSDDPFEIIHFHIAKSPISPKLIKNEIPEVISQIVLKLLSKNAEDRYQSAYGLYIDLKNCLEKLIQDSIIVNFAIGKQDVPHRFEIKQKLYGREQQIKILMDSYQRVCNGSSEIMMISGYSGIGKTSVVKEIHKHILKKKGYFTSGKFEEFNRDIPYTSIAQAFKKIIRQILTQNDDSINSWRSKIINVLGKNAPLVTSVIPDIELLIGKQYEIEDLTPTEAQNRFNYVFKNFVALFTKDETPLVLFLDDLQWADQASLKLIHLLISEPAIDYLFIIGAYRDNQVSISHPLSLELDAIEKEKLIVEKIRIEPLSKDALHQLITEALNDHSEKVNNLTQLIFEKTNGNPFFVNELFKTIYDEGALEFNPLKGLWLFNMDKIIKLNITNNVIDLLSEKIEKLSYNSIRLLKMASCIGNTFDLKLLSMVYGKSYIDTSEDLWQTLKEGLILPVNNNYRFMKGSNEQDISFNNFSLSYIFLHDKVQQASYYHASEKERKHIHHEIGNFLALKINKDENIFAVANHLNFAIDLLNEKERKVLAEINLKAARKAKISTAYISAKNYAETTLKLLEKDKWNGEYNLTYSTYLLLSECEYLIGNFSKAEEYFDEILQYARNDKDKANVFVLRIVLYTNQGKLNDAINYSLNCLKTLGVNIPVKPGKVKILTEMFKAKILLANKKIENLINLPEAKNERFNIVSNLIVEMNSPSYFVNHDLWRLLVLINIQMYLKFANSDSALTYISYGIITANMGDPKTGYKFGELALAINEKYQNLHTKAKVYTIMGFDIIPWNKHLKESLPYLNDGFSYGIETGDLVSSGFCALFLIYLKTMKGDNLQEIFEEINKYIDFVDKNNQNDVIPVFQITQQMILNLQNKTQNINSFSDNLIDENTLLKTISQSSVKIPLNWFYLCKIQTLYIHGNFEAAYQYAVELDKIIHSSISLILVPEHYFFYSLILTALFEKASEKDKFSFQKIIKKNINQLSKFVKNCPENFLHKQLLIQAELYRIQNKSDKAGEYYERAIESAKENEYIQNQAIANELAANFYYNKNKRIARMYITESIQGYQSWGAIAKYKVLSEKYFSSHKNPPAKPKKLNTTDLNMVFSNSVYFDFVSLLKSVQAISGEIDLPKLLQKMMKIVIENAGAEKGTFILENENLTIEAEGKINNSNIDLLNHIPINNSNELPLTIINYVQRTKEVVALSNACIEGIFINDPYIIKNNVKSILCIPIINKVKLIGILYLENNLMTDSFTIDRVEILKLISSQIGISIENAYLYSNLNQMTESLKISNVQLENHSQTLENRVEERTIELINKNDELQKAIETLRTTQDQLIQQEKLATLGALTASIAHEIKNPLNFVNSFSQLCIEFVKELEEHIKYCQINGFEPNVTHEINLLMEYMNKNSFKINEHGKRASNIINTMLMHSKSKMVNKENTDINKLIEQCIELAFHGMKGINRYRNVKIETNLDQNIEKIAVIPQDISRVLINLISNSCYSLKCKSFYEKDSFQPTIIISTKKLDNSIDIKVRDNGEGIPKEIINSIFTPFFTTKPSNEGVGLGLSVSYDTIVNVHKGQINVLSQENEYTEFTINLTI